MKNIIILAVVVAGITLIGLSTYNVNEEVIVHKEVEHVEVLPEWVSEDCESCREAYQKEQDRLELKAKEQELVDQIVGLQAELDTVRGELQSLWTEKALIREIRKTFPEQPNTFAAIARGESELNTYAYNPEWHYDANGNKVCQGSYGLMQIACVHVLDPLKLYDPEYNLTVARQVYEKQGITAWGAYTDKRYLAYLY